MARPDAAHPRHVRPRRHPRLLAHRQPVDAAQPLHRQAPALHVRRLHRAVDQHLGGGGGLRGPPDLRGQGRLQERGPRAHRLRQLAPDPHVGLEPGRRHLRHRHVAVPEAGQEARGQDHLRGSAAHAHELGAGRPARVHPPVDRHRGAARDGLRDRDRGPARPGLPGPPRPRLRRGAPARGRAGRRVVPRVPARRGRRGAEDARVGRRHHRGAGRDRCARSRSSTRRASRPRSRPATRRGARSTASSSTARPTRSAR